ncbi:MAG: hypothetical protein QM582_06310 [Micropruina sp.]|uniref:hypothetical protein n=1 Tax=Micropruina sp. TaxID=2737536 RepID=UPI0039E70B7C
MSTPFRPIGSGRAGSTPRALLARTGLVAVGALLALTGCTADDPDPGPSLIGTRGQLCDGRVDAAKAESVIDQPVSGLRELSTFEAGRRVGECALQSEDGGALLSVQVVHDPKGTVLLSELEKLSQTDNYSGDQRSGVTGESRSTTALLAVDNHYYVRVLGLGGTSEQQRQAALELAEDVATHTAPLK